MNRNLCVRALRMGILWTIASWVYAAENPTKGINIVATGAFYGMTPGQHCQISFGHNTVFRTYNAYIPEESYSGTLNFYNGLTADAAGSARSLLPSGFFFVEPGKTYKLDVRVLDNEPTPTATSGDITILAPPGYIATVDGAPTETVRFLGNSATIYYQLRRSGGQGRSNGPQSSVTPTLAVDLEISLGSLLNGESAGAIALVDAGNRSDWSPLFTPALLNYETDSPEIIVNRQNGILRQVIAPQVVADVVPISPSSYAINCYHPQQMDYSVTPAAPLPNAEPFLAYIFAPAPLGTGLQIAREWRDITSLTGSAPVARRERMSINRTGGASVTDFSWTRTAWTLDESSPLVQTSTQSTSAGTSRNVSMEIRDSAGTVATAITQTYGSTGSGEAILSQTRGAGGTALTRSFDYWPFQSFQADSGKLKSEADNSGEWVAYEYNNWDYSGANYAGALKAGKLKATYRPYGNAPAAVTLSGTQGSVTNYDYAPDESGAYTRLAFEEQKVNGVIVRRATTTYQYDFWYRNNTSITSITTVRHSAASASETTITREYRRDWGASLLRGQPYSITHPNGLRIAYAYENGTWNGTTFTPNTLYTGSASRISVIKGSSSPSAGTQMLTHNGKEVEEIFLVAGKSAMDVTIRDARALVVRTESTMWNGAEWVTTAWTNFSYDLAGRLTGRQSSNGAIYSATYAGRLKTAETDEQGVVKTYTYDSAGRISTGTRQGSGVIGTLVTKYTYDAADRVIEERVGWGQTEQIIMARQYDDAGRIISETPPGLGTTTHSYNVSARTHTVTRPDGGTIITTKNLDGELTSKTGTAAIAEHYSYGVETGTGVSGFRWHKVNIGSSGSPRWTKKTSDWLGREVKSERPGFAGGANYLQESFYDSPSSLGHLWKSTKTGTAATLYEYDALGQLSRSGLDVNGNDVLDLASNDRIADTETVLESYNGAYWLRTDTKAYPYANSSTSITTATTRTRLTGHPADRLSEVQSIDAEGIVTIEVFDVDRTARTATKTQTRTGLSGSATTELVNGFQVSSTTYDGLTTTTGYDSLLRAATTTDSRGNTVSTVFVSGTARPSTVIDDAGHQTVFHHDSSGQVDWQRDQRNHYTRYSYNLRGQVIHQWGDGTIPVEYDYDNTYGDRTTMSTFRGGTGWDGTTWPASPGTADITTWTFDAGSGLLASKTDALNRTVSHTYCSCGKVFSRTGARGITTNYGYDPATGEMTNINYSDGTPAITYTHTRLGQTATVSDATGTRTFSYDSAKPWRLNGEAFGSFYNSRVFTRLYETTGMPGRLRGFQLGSSSGSNVDLEQTFGYTAPGRFETLTSARNSNAVTRTFRYGYEPNSALLTALSIDGSHPFTVTRTYDPDRNLVASIETQWSTTSRVKYDFTYDERRNRSSVVQAGDVYADYGDATHRIFTYNGRGELTADVGYMNATPTSQTNPLPGRNYEFAYDDAGNRQSSNRTGVSTLRDEYTTNALNQYVTQENNTVPLSGTANTDAVVAVKGRTVAAGREGRYWNDEITVNNQLKPWHGNLTVYTAKHGGGAGGSDLYRTDMRTAQLAQALQTFSYDDDGNLTSDGIWDYGWDGENRLTWMETTTDAANAGFPQRRLEFKYDYMNRRVQKRHLDITSGATELSSCRYLYDGWNLIAEFNAPGGTSIGSLTRSYTWGLDIVHSLTSAGGVGALLQVVDHASGMSYLPTYDANGNIASLLDADTGSAAAIYEYSPFGELVRCEGSYAKQNPFRFSTKFTDDETTLVYYGRRYYSSSQGRFLGRDPIGESGGINLYGFVGNNPINQWDYLGMCSIPMPRAGRMYNEDEMQQYEAEIAEWEEECKAEEEEARMMERFVVRGERYTDPFSGSLSPFAMDPDAGLRIGYSSGSDDDGTLSDASSASRSECSGDAGAAAVATAPQPTSNPPAQVMGAPAGTSSTPDPTKNGSPHIVIENFGTQVNYSKLVVGTINYIRGFYKGATGALQVSMSITVLHENSKRVATPQGAAVEGIAVAMLVNGLKDVYGSTALVKRGTIQLAESLNSNSAFELQNVLGLAPFGQLIDDSGEEKTAMEKIRKTPIAEKIREACTFP